MNTPFEGWQPNKIFAVTKEYGGRIACVTDVAADEVERTLTFRGVIPFHDKTSETPILKEWTFRVALTSDNKLDFKFHFETPDGALFKDCGIFFECPGARDEKRVYAPKTVKDWYNFCDSELITDLPSDSIRLSLKTKSYIHPFKDRAFRYSPLKLDWHYVIDPGQISPAAPLPPGGVDFVKNDNLVIPGRCERNLFLNPYFAQGSNYFWCAGTALAAGSSDRCVPTEEVALFGKYSMPALGQLYLNAVPVEPGEYMMSFFARGKGSVYVQVADETSWYSSHKRGNITLNGGDEEWKRYEFPFNFNKRGAINIVFRATSAKDTVAYLDGFQLEAGSKATEFEAPLISAGLVSPDGMNFFELGKPAKCELELSTLSKKTITGKAEISITNFFKENVLSLTENFSFKAAEYPRLELPIAHLPQGIYVVRCDFTVAGEDKVNSEFFRFAIMPWLENKHATARIFSMTYHGGFGLIRTGGDKLLNRYRQVGVGCFGHCSAFTQEALETYKKYNVIPFDGGFSSRASSANFKKKFPDLEVPAGSTFFYLGDPTLAHWSEKDGILPDYRLVGGWNEQYREKFIAVCIEQLKKMPGVKAYRFGSEWPFEIKSDPHYPDMVVAFAEAVKTVYPDAWAYEAGDCNMDIRGGVAQLDFMLACWEGREWKPDLIACHTYVKDITQLWPNLKAFLAVAEKHGYGEAPVAFPEGMHFSPHQIPEWGREIVSWGVTGWYGAGALSYDLGWHEMICTAYYMRCYLVYFTIFDRLWCGTSSANYVNCFAMDLALTPRAVQKVPNTLGTLLGNPQKFVGDFTFAPGTKCFVWIDEQGCPLAAVWNEDKELEAGKKDCPVASFSYKNASFYDMMGVEREPVEAGAFPVSPFPYFIKGRQGDLHLFTDALLNAKLSGGTRLPFRISDSVVDENKLALVFTSELARPLHGEVEIAGEKHPVKLEKSGSRRIEVPLTKKLSAEEINKINIPFTCHADGMTMAGEMKSDVILAKKYTGDWSKLPSVKITNLHIWKSDAQRGYPGDFSAAFQVAWDTERLYLRIVVEDDIFTPGSGPGNRWNYDCVQVYFDTRCSARAFGRTTYDEDDYDYTLMPTADGENCEVFRALSPDMQLTLGTAAPKDNEIAENIPVSFTRTEQGYVYEVAFPAWALLPMRLEKGYNTGFALYVIDRDGGDGGKQALSLAVESGKSCYNKPHLWPLLILTE